MSGHQDFEAVKRKLARSRRWESLGWRLANLLEAARAARGDHLRLCRSEVFLGRADDCARQTRLLSRIFEFKRIPLLHGRDDRLSRIWWHLRPTLSARARSVDGAHASVP